MGGLQRKNLYKLLEICNEHSGEILPSAKSVLALFGYSTTTRLSGTYAHSFIKRVMGGWELGNWILTPQYMLDPLYIHNGFCRWHFERESLWMYPKESIPFWMLKEFGGKY